MTLDTRTVSQTQPPSSHAPTMPQLTIAWRRPAACSSPGRTRPPVHLALSGHRNGSHPAATGARYDGDPSNDLQASN